MALSMVSIVAGNEARAEELLLDSLERARARKNRLVLVELLRVRGKLLARRRRRDEAECAFEVSVSIARTIRHPYAEARTLYEWGLMCAGGAHPGMGKTLLEEAAGIFSRLGARPYCAPDVGHEPRPKERNG